MKIIAKLWILLCIIAFCFKMEAQVTLPDNMVEAECTTDVESFKWGVVNAWSSPTVVSNLNIPLVGDLDGDGYPEIICFSLAGQSHYVNDGYIGNVGFEMLVYDGVTHQLKATVTMDSPVSEYDAAAYGLVRTSNGKGLIVVASYDNHLRAYDITSATPGTPYWVSDVDYTSGSNNYAVNVSFVDFNGDGHPEVYVRNKVYNAETGHLLAEANTSNAGLSYAHYSQFTHRKLSSPFAADVCGDGRPELILGNEIYDVSITNPNGTDGNTITLVQQITPPEGAPADGHAQVADFNMDGHLDVFISIKNTDAQMGTVYCYVWDVYNGQVSNSLTINTNRSGKSIPLIADIDNDGMLEIVLQSGAATNHQIQAYKYNAVTQSFSLMWDMVPDEDSFSNSFTAFDFNLDGLLELIICDQSTLKIVNGSGKSHITHNDTVSVYVLSSLPFSETTIMQYPVIVDVDADGAAEIVSVGSSKLNIFKSSNQPWAPGRPVWNQYLYNVTNINKDLTVPVTLFNNAITFTDPQGVVRRPFNNFLQQATKLDQYGRPFAMLANLSISGNPVVEFERDYVSVEVCNTGELAFDPPMYVSVYTASGELVQTEELVQGLLPCECITIPLSISQSELKQFSRPYPLRIAINDSGEGTAQYGGLQAECDTADNYAHIDGRPCQMNVPNVITPNGDGFNDVFEPQLEGDFHSMIMEIYDRWGKRVYRQESNESLFWDASGVSDGVYYCAIEFSCVQSAGKRQLMNTSVTVVR
jgi:gliding motility-associated-like protein